MCYGSFPTRNGSKSTIATQKSDKVNKATEMYALGTGYNKKNGFVIYSWGLVPGYCKA